MSLLRFPEPYDFELSMGRFRAFGTDLASRFADGKLHRVVAGREVVIQARPGGVDVEPLDERTEPVVAHLLGAPFDLDAFYAFAATDSALAPIAERLRGFRPPLQPDPFEALITSITAQQVSLFAAVAIRNRFVARFGVQVGEAWAFPTRERIAAADERELVAVGFTRRKAEYAVALARAWPAGDLVLRKAAQDLYGVDVTELGRRLDPFQNLAAHYLLTGWMTRP